MRQAQVERDHVGLDGAPLREGLCAVAADAHVDVPAPERALEGELHRGVVFDEQQLHRARDRWVGAASVFSPVWWTAN
ncbi:hypothetical protein D9M69_717460 [compost metagenome]